MCAEAKQRLRHEMRARRAALSVQERCAQAGQIAAHMLTHPAYRAAGTVFCYCSAGDEIDTNAILRDVLASGKRLCVPRCTRPGVMEARQILRLDALHPGAYGIAEPDAQCPLVPPDEIDLCIAPCLCADLDGYRLGYGGGYYDRFFARMTGQLAALCAADRLLAQPLPRAATDRPCDWIVTEKGVFVSRER